MFSDGTGRTLLVSPTYRPHWQLPGGVVDADESPRAAATRAVRRELGLDLELGRLLVVDWKPPTPGGIEGLLFVYDGGTLTAEQSQAVTLPPDEHEDWAWCTRQELVDRLPAHMLRRTVAAIGARSDGSTGYLEDGLAA